MPWYNRGDGRVHALGDLAVVSVGRPPDAVRHTTDAVRTLRALNLRDAQGNRTGQTVADRITPHLERELRQELALALEATDPGSWQALLRSGLTVGGGDMVLRVRFRLQGNTEAPRPLDRDPLLTKFLSKYGDIAFVSTAARETSRGLGFLGEVIRSAGSALASGIGTFKPGFVTTRSTRHGVADEVQLGNRATNGFRVGVAHSLSIEIDAHLRDGVGAQTVHPVADKQVVASYPSAYGAGTPSRPGVPSGHPTIAVTDSTAIERFDYTLGAVDTAPLENEFLKTLIGPGRVAPKNAAHVVDVATEAFLDEKSMRDRGQALFTDSLPTNFIRLKGFSGYTGLRARVVSVERVASTEDGGIRNDIAETVTVDHTTGHGQETSLRFGPEFSLAKGVTIAANVVVGMKSQHSTGTQVQGQAKTAVIHDGDKVRYRAVLQVQGRIEADRTIHAGRDHLGRTDPVLGFGANVVGELMVPEHQSAQFEQAIARPPVPAPRRQNVRLDAAAALNVVTRIGPGRRPSRVHAPVAQHTPKVYRSLLKSAAAAEPSPFPRHGVADSANYETLRQHVARQPADSVSIHVPAGAPLSPAQLRTLWRMQAGQGARIFRIPADVRTGAHERLTIDEQLNHIAVAVERTEAFQTHRGFVLDPRGVDHGWIGKGAAVTRNPARDPAPAQGHAAQDTSPGAAIKRLFTNRPAAAAGHPAREVENLHSVRDLANRAAEPGKPRDIALVAPGTRGPALDGHIATLGDTPGLRTTVRTKEHDLLGDRDLPSEGYVANPAGRLAWGWRQAGTNRWGTDAPTRHDALADLARQAGRTGLQLVVKRDSPFATELRETARALRPDDWLTTDAEVTRRGQLQDQLAAARENDGAGLDGLTDDQLRQLLVTDRSVRIVDEHGIALPELNARETIGGRTVDVNGIATREYEVVDQRPVDTSLRLNEERAVAENGRLLRSVAWQPDGTVVPHVRRAVHVSDPRRETPELVAGVGLGSAAVKELPGGEQVHAAVRSLVNEMAGDLPNLRHGNRPGAPQADTRRDRTAARRRFKLDKQLQLTLGTPKLRGARGRGLDTGVQEEFRFRGRTYRVSVEQVLLDRRSDPARTTEPKVAIDHQVKGTRGTGSTVKRSWNAGADVGAGGRVELPHGGALDIGDAAVVLTGSKSHGQSDGKAAKGYSRLRAPGGTAFRPEYGARYQVTVTETTRRFSGFRERRTVSRIIEGDRVTVPAIVHEAFRPDDNTARGAAYVEANRAVIATIGRTSVLSEGEHDDLRAHPDRIDFSRSGTDGLHATFAGLGDTVRTASKAVIAQARRTNPQVPDSAWRHPPYVAEVERAVAEGFLRSNLPRLLSEEGLPIPLPKEFHSPLLRLTRPNAERSFTLRGFLVRADRATRHVADDATVESYSENDLKQTDTHTTRLGLTGEFSLGPAYQKPTGQEDSGGGGEEHTGADETGGALSNSNRRAIADKFHASVKTEFNSTLYGKTEAATKGSIDISLLTEKVSQVFHRAHLVLEITADRQPVESWQVTRNLNRKLGFADHEARTDTTRLLVENAVEVSMSRTLDDDVRDAQRLNPPPDKDDQTRYIPRHDAAFAAGYATHFDDRAAVFDAQGAVLPHGALRMGPGTGIGNAIRNVLRESNLIEPEHLTDTSDAWRGIATAFDPEELKTHPHDLLNTGITHRVEVPGRYGSTRRFTVRVRAQHMDTDHIRSRDQDAVTLGGQSLKQTSESRNQGWDFSIGAGAGGQFTRDGAGGGTPFAALKWGTGRETTAGNQAVVRDIRRATAAAGSEEFLHQLDVSIEIYADTELPVPLNHLDRPGVGAVAPAPLVSIRTVHDGTAQPPRVTLRTVVPRHLTEQRRHGDPLPPAPQANRVPPPAVELLAPGEHGRPGGLEYFLASNLQALTFPDLEHVAAWAPTASLGRGEAAPFVNGRPRAGGGGPAAPHLDRYAPTTDQGVRMTSSLANRNVRDNTRDLFQGTFELPGPGDTPMRLGVETGVIRPVGEPSMYLGLTFTERADEPFFSEEHSSGWTANMTFGGNTADGAGIPDFHRGVSKGRENEATTGDYVEFNRQFTQDSYTYRGRVSYIVDGPANGTALRIRSHQDFEGLLPNDWAVLAAQEYPAQVVHPHAFALPDDQAARDVRVGQIAAGRRDRPADETIHLVADLNGGTGIDAFRQAARQLAVEQNRTVDLAVVHYRGDVADHLEHHVFEADEPSHHEAVRRATKHEDKLRNVTQPAADLAVAQQALANEDRQPLDERARAYEALRQDLGNDPRSADELYREYQQARQARVDTWRSSRGGDAAPNTPDTPDRTPAEEEAVQAYDRARAAYTRRADLIDAVAQREPAARDAERAIAQRERDVGAAQARLDDVRRPADRAAARADMSRAVSAQHAQSLGQARTADAEHRSDLSNLATPDQTVQTAWQPTPSGFALPNDNARFAAAHTLPAHSETTVVAVDTTVDAGGNYTLRGRVMTRTELATGIVDQLLAASAETPLPRRVVIHGDDSAALAQAVSLAYQRHPDAATLPRIDVIGVRGTIAQAEAGASFVGRLTATADRLPLVNLDPAGWVVHRAGLPRLLDGRHRYADLAALLAALDATIVD
ncbi:hypothetical protein [Catenulispora rubra]|uniref:hypothetical protein n=1 Tax=Catenulispora rubra TaxID=280293 RepID=UPI001E2E0249|nr:hypothetical protein [Catenulispora rubra]